jgi:pimeloyl-ACP methyl ester carboxylesterase
MPELSRPDGARLTYERRPAAAQSRGTFIFQHGMGGDRQQPLGYISSLDTHDLVCMDARGHGDSSDVDRAHCDFDSYADDVVALADELGQEKVVVGGISLGAAVAINVAVRYPGRVAALVLCRPAWLDHPQASLNRGIYARIADLLDRHSPDDAVDLLTADPIYQAVDAESPSAASSLRHQVTRHRGAANACILRYFPSHAPLPDLARLNPLDVPALVLGHHDDPFHPWFIAERLTAALPHGLLVEVPSKDQDPAGFSERIDDEVRRFLAAVPSTSIETDVSQP